MIGMGALPGYTLPRERPRLYLGLDVYEEEEQIFFEDRSGLIIPDDVFARLLTFPNVIITGHQAFFTCEALQNIAATTIDNITRFENGQTVEKL